MASEAALSQQRCKAVWLIFLLLGRDVWAVRQEIQARATASSLTTERDISNAEASCDKDVVVTLSGLHDEGVIHTYRVVAADYAAGWLPVVAFEGGPETCKGVYKVGCEGGAVRLRKDMQCGPTETFQRYSLHHGSAEVVKMAASSHFEFLPPVALPNMTMNVSGPALCVGEGGRSPCKGEVGFRVSAHKCKSAETRLNASAQWVVGWSHNLCRDASKECRQPIHSMLGFGMKFHGFVRTFKKAKTMGCHGDMASGGDVTNSPVFAELKETFIRVENRLSKPFAGERFDAGVAMLHKAGCLTGKMCRLSKSEAKTVGDVFRTGKAEVVEEEPETLERDQSPLESALEKELTDADKHGTGAMCKLVDQCVEGNETACVDVDQLTLSSSEESATALMEGASTGQVRKPIRGWVWVLVFVLLLLLAWPLAVLWLIALPWVQWGKKTTNTAILPNGPPQTLMTGAQGMRMADNRYQHPGTNYLLDNFGRPLVDPRTGHPVVMAVKGPVPLRPAAPLVRFVTDNEGQPVYDAPTGSKCLMAQQDVGNGVVVKPWCSVPVPDPAATPPPGTLRTKGPTGVNVPPESTTDVKLPPSMSDTKG